jgi:hypothetical protein
LSYPFKSRGHADVSTFAAARSGASTCAPAAAADDEADAEKEGDDAASTRIFLDDDAITFRLVFSALRTPPSPDTPLPKGSAE